MSPILGTTISSRLQFLAEDSKPVLLSEVISGDLPVIIVPVYYGCPRLCGLLMDGVVKLISKLELSLGTDYRVISVSFDPQETPENARIAAAKYLKAAGLSEPTAQAWKFLVGNTDNVNKLMAEIGFNFIKDGEEFAHSAAIILLTPQGQISQYFTGISFSPWDVRLALIEASQGRLGSALDHVLLFCFRFDPTKGKYTWAAFNLARVAAFLTFLLLAGLVIGLLRKERAVYKAH